MRTENSPEYEAAMEKRRAEDDRKTRRHEKARKRAHERIWSATAPWESIEKCPFAAYAGAYEYEGCVLVTNGKSVARASIRERFGRPQFWVGEGEIETVYRDGNLYFEGDGEFREPDWPEWLFKWEFTDEDGLMNYAGGHETGKNEVDFIPTHWMPLPGPPAVRGYGGAKEQKESPQS